MGIQTMGKSLAIGSPAEVVPDSGVTRPGHGARFSAGIVLIACLGFLTYQQLPRLAPLARQQRDAADSALMLQVDSQGSDLRVSWSRSATAIARAQAGLLSIRDGNSPPQELRLDADQLHTGSALYSSGSNKVQFALTLFEPDGQNVSEYVLALSPLRVPMQRDDRDPTSMSPVSGPFALLDSRPSGTDQLLTPRKPLVEGNAEGAMPTPSTEQNPAGAKARVIDPGEVVRRVVPDVPQKARGTLQGTLRVRVRVRVDASGNVTAAKLDSHGPSKYFAGLAMEAAKRWKFDPPRSNSRVVSSEWTLRFEFRRTATRVLPERTAP